MTLALHNENAIETKEFMEFTYDGYPIRADRRKSFRTVSREIKVSTPSRQRIYEKDS